MKIEEKRKKLAREIDKIPDDLLQEVYDFLLFLKHKKNRKQISDITFASESALAKDWLKEEEDEAWKDL